jgi:hypothetical protein
VSGPRSSWRPCPSQRTVCHKTRNQLRRLKLKPIDCRYRHEVTFCLSFFFVLPSLLEDRLTAARWYAGNVEAPFQCKINRNLIWGLQGQLTPRWEWPVQHVIEGRAEVASILLVAWTELVSVEIEVA